jgi:hypothetical protein
VIVTPPTGVGAVQLTMALLLLLNDTVTALGAFGVVADAGSTAKSEKTKMPKTETAVPRRRAVRNLIFPPISSQPQDAKSTVQE